jgi:inner membrane protein
MDTLTHILIGASVGQIFSTKKPFSTKENDYKPVIWGAIAGNIPDIDTVFQFFISSPDSMFFHRGLSHSILLWFIGAPLLALLINKIYKGDKHSYFNWLTISCLAWATHLILDLFNTYGTGLFEPFSHARISYDIVNVIDLLLLIFILPTVVFMIFVVKKLSTKKILARLILFFSVAYLFVSLNAKVNVEFNAKIQFFDEDIRHSRLTASPLPLSILAWKVVVENNDGYYSGVYYGFWKRRIIFTYLPKNKQLREDLLKYDDFRTLERFTNGWYNLVPQENGEIIFNDLRFGSLDREKSALSLPLHLTGNSLTIGRSHINRQVNYRNITDFFKNLFAKQHHKVWGLPTRGRKK